MEATEKAGWTGLVVGALLVGLSWVGMTVTQNPADAAGRVHKEVIQVEGTAFCTEDARLVPVWDRGYHPERVAGWVYTCKNFEERGKFAR